MKTDKEFKCVAYKYQAQIGIYKEIKNLTPGEEIKYFHGKVEAGIFAKLWERLHGAPITTGGHGKG